MFNLNNIVASIKNSQEKALLFSCLGITRGDWPLIEKLGGPDLFIESDLFLKKLEQKMVHEPIVGKFLTTLREGLDKFYEHDGFLIDTRDVPQLSTIKNLPLVFFGRFKQALLKQRPCIALVGSRMADHSALKITHHLSAQLADRGICVVSGGAAGIDFAAHEGAVSAGGSTIIVSGVACSFLKSDINPLLRGLGLENQCVLFPYGPTMPQGKYMFVERNRYVVALADAVVVVQGNSGSGTLHTARFAEELNIPLFAIPGALNNPLSFAPNSLLSQGKARALIDVQQLEELFSSTRHVAKKKVKETSPLPEKLSSALLNLLKDRGGLATMDELMLWSQRPYLSLQGELLEYEMEGLVVKQGAHYVLAQ